MAKLGFQQNCVKIILRNHSTQFMIAIHDGETSLMAVHDLDEHVLEQCPFFQ